MLAVVEHQQQAFRLQKVRERRRRTTRLGARAEHTGDGLRHVIWIHKRRQLDEPHTVWEVVDVAREVRGDAQREPRLPRATSSCQGHQARVAEQPTDRGNGRFSPHEARELRRKIRAHSNTG